MDNLNCANNSVDINIKLYESRKIFLNRGFNLRKWSSNCKEVQVLAKKDDVYDDSNTIVVIGVIWEVEEDM